MSKAKQPPPPTPEPEPAAPEVVAPVAAPAVAPVPVPAPAVQVEVPKARVCRPEDRAADGLKRFKVYGLRPRIYCLAASADDAKALYGDGSTLVVELPD